jgi:hypothetical protein
MAVHAFQLPFSRARAFALVAAVAFAGFSACGSGTPTEVTGKGQIVSVLLPESLLTTGCCNWPNEEFSETNHAVMHVKDVGRPAIDFTLLDLSGTPHRLSKLLETRPVFLVFGSFT